MPPAVELVRLSVEHVDALAALWVANRDDLRRFNPSRYGQPLTLADAREAAMQGATEVSDRRHGFVVVSDGELVGHASISQIVRFPLESANVGVFVDARSRGQGIGTAALRHACELAFGEPPLHRVEAGAQPSNLPSLAMIRRAGFTEIGLAPRFLFVDGAWRDHILFQKLAPDA